MGEIIILLSMAGILFLIAAIAVVMSNTNKPIDEKRLYEIAKRVMGEKNE